MRITSHRAYNGKIRLAVFDWAGTTVDFGCQAPVAAFIAGFKAKGLDISPRTARGPMGMEKRDHIKAITAVPEVARAWRMIHGRPVTDNDIDEMYGEFVPHLLATLESNSGLIPGVTKAAEALTEKAITIGSTTGYFRQAADIVAAFAAKAGFTPIVSISSSDVTHGRPYPWMIFKAMEACNICPPEAVVNIGDTEVDMIAGRNGGVWTVGVAATGNELGLTQTELEALDHDTRHLKITAVHEKLYAAGAHWVIDTMDELPAIIDEINNHLAEGNKP